jgi:hypothetical protein
MRRRQTELIDPIIDFLLGSTKTIRAVRSNRWLGVKAHHR